MSKKKMELKEEILKLLRDEMMEDEDSELERPYGKSKMKATIMADSEEGLMEGA